MQGGTEEPKDEQSPAIEGLGCPLAEQQPSVFPRKHEQSLAQGPGAVIGGGLGFHFGGGRTDQNEEQNAEGWPRIMASKSARKALAMERG